jgi:phosphoribosylglycinamide formyltransferase 1
MKNIVIFASGSGSNAEKIILHFKNNSQGNVLAVFSNNLHAKVLDIAKNNDIAAVVFNKEALSDGTVLAKINDMKPDLIVLAGFLLKFPEAIIQKYPNQIVNIHPALLPKYGGKGMYGMNVHRAVLENKETETGISIHYVNEHYDEGAVVFQQSVSIDQCTTPEEIAEKVQQLEHDCFPLVIERLLTNSAPLTFGPDHNL